jgi:hypothetical protein
MAKNYEEYVEEQVDQIKADSKEAADQVRSDAEGARFDQPDTVETEEQYHERLAAVRGAMIFGDTDTTAGATASGTDVPSADNEAATMAVAEAHEDQEEGDVDADVTQADARRQVDVSTGTTPSAEEADAGAEAREEAAGEGDVAPAAGDDGLGAQGAAANEVREAQQSDGTSSDEDEELTPQQKAARTRAARKAESEQS